MGGPRKKGSSSVFAILALEVVVNRGGVGAEVEAGRGGRRHALWASKEGKGSGGEHAATHATAHGLEWHWEQFLGFEWAEFRC